MCSGSQEPRGAGPPNIRCRLARCRREPAPPPLLSGSRRRVGKGDWLSWLFGSICGVMLAREVWGGGVRQIQVRGTPSRRVGERARLPSQGSSGFCLFFSTFVDSAERPAKKVVLPTHRCGHEGRERSRTATLSSRPSRQTMRKGWTLSTRAADVAPNPVFVGQGLTIIGIVKAVCGKGDVTGMAEEEEEEESLCHRHVVRICMCSLRRHRNLALPPRPRSGHAVGSDPTPRRSQDGVP